MSSNNHGHSRELQQDARAWAHFTGTKYTAALRQMTSPFAQEFLGDRVSARHLIAVLVDHPVIGADDDGPILSDNGFYADEPWMFNGETDYIELAMLIGVSEREHDYVSRMVRDGHRRPQAHHFRPDAFTYLTSALDRAAADEFADSRWVPSTPVQEAAPFHDWLVLQSSRNDPVGDFAFDYTAGVRDSDHRPARTPDELLSILYDVSHSPEAYDAAVSAIADWLSTSPLATPIRTERIGGDSHDVAGYGAGAGTAERDEFRCPCGDGAIIEEHENVPGFREHDVWIDCDKCRAEWRFVDGRPTRQWGLAPAVV